MGFSDACLLVNSVVVFVVLYFVLLCSGYCLLVLYCWFVCFASSGCLCGLGFYSVAFGALVLCFCACWIGCMGFRRCLLCLVVRLVIVGFYFGLFAVLVKLVFGCWNLFV